MSLQAWEREDEDQASVGPVSSTGSFHQSGSECEAAESLKDRAWAQESDSDHRCSSESSERPASTFNSDAPHVVPCKFVISLAFPLISGYKGKFSSLVEKYRRQPKAEKAAAKVHHYYHVEYVLLPDDAEPKKADVLLFPTVAKVFLDSGVRTIKPWQEGDRFWVSWTQAFSIKVTKELLKKINFHKITLTVWDTKEKVSKRVKYYRLKPSGFMEDTGSFGESGEVKNLVLSQRRLSEQGVHVSEEQCQDHTPEKLEKPRRSLKSVHDAETLSGHLEDHEKLLRSEELATVQWGDSKPVTSLGGATTTEAKELIEKPSFSSLTNLLEKQKFQIKRKESAGRRKMQRRKKSRGEGDVDVRLAGHVKHGSFSIQLEVLPLLAGRPFMSCRWRLRTNWPSELVVLVLVE
uniref:Cilia and flagella associated protein 92 (putative) n=1 Tax=Moschus moschiferus TaxID=68415 RepID=A0A8C6G0X1_MOSMO